MRIRLLRRHACPFCLLMYVLLHVHAYVGIAALSTAVSAGQHLSRPVVARMPHAASGREYSHHAHASGLCVHAMAHYWTQTPGSTYILLCLCAEIFGDHPFTKDSHTRSSDLDSEPQRETHNLMHPELIANQSKYNYLSRELSNCRRLDTPAT